MKSDSLPFQSVSGPFDRFRAGFPALMQKTYLSICDKMILHDDVRRNIELFLSHLAMASANRTDHERSVVGAREKFAQLMSVDFATIAAVRNVSDGVNSVAWALPMSEGDNIVVSAAAEHPNNVYPWLRQRERGIEMRSVPPNADGSIDVAGMIDAMDRRTKLATCASVTFAPGHRTDIVRLGEACRARDVFFLIDGVQTAGVLKHDLANEPVDGFATSTSKGLLGLYGFGFLYISPKWIDRLEPAYLSRPAVSMTTDDHSAMGGYDYKLQPDSRRFEVGSYNLAGAYAASASLDLLLNLGARQIEERVLALAGLLNDKIAALGLKPGGAQGGPQRSHIVTFGALDAGGHGFSRDPKIMSISAFLNAENIVHTIRRGQLRFAVHAYNNETDIEHAAACVRDALNAV